MTTVTAQRHAISVTVALVVGVIARVHLPWRADDAVLVLVALHQPVLYRLLYAVYVTVLFTTPYLLASVLCALTFIFIGRRQRAANAGALPDYPEASDREALFLVLGEQHQATRPIPSPAPQWLTIPARGLYTGIAVIGAVGSGKTSGCLYPYAEQLFGYKADDPAARLGGLVLEVKGDFCHDVRRMLRDHDREQDYVEVSLDGPWRYNPLHNDLDAYALAYGIATVINATFGKGKEPFWQQAYTNLVKFLILLHRVADDYVTLFDIYRCAIDPNALANKVREAEARCGPRTFVAVPLDLLDRYPDLTRLEWATDVAAGVGMTRVTDELKDILQKQGIPHTTRTVIEDADRAEQFAAVKRWYEHDWQRIEPKLRTSIVEGISVFLSLFDENSALKRVFCPPKACYAPCRSETEREPAHGRPLPSFAEMIDTGKVCALNFPTVSNPGLAKLIGTLMKQDFQRAVLERIPRMTREPERRWREVLFLCDEYQAFATAGEEDPSGDDRFFALSRQGKCIAIVATQSISSLKSALPGESWRTLLQTFRTKVFLTLSDDVSARIASDLAGRAERLVPNYHLSESGQDARISMLTGRAAAHRSTISTSKSYALQRNPVFEPKVFTELKNAQAIVLAYDGASPLPPTYCYLKPRHLDRTRTWFQHLAEGKV